MLEPRRCHSRLCRLSFFRNLQDYRILVCGGDGTVGWILDAIGEILETELVKVAPPPPPLTSCCSRTQTKPTCWRGRLSLCFLWGQETTWRDVSAGEGVRNTCSRVEWESSLFSFAGRPGKKSLTRVSCVRVCFVSARFFIRW